MRPIGLFACLALLFTLPLAACSGGSSGARTSSGGSASGGSSSGDSGGSSKPTRLAFSPIDSSALQCAEPSSGIEGTGRQKFVGQIDAVAPDGTLVVDGHSYSASDAVVYINGSCASLTDLRVGHVVTVVSGATKTQLATASVVYSDDDIAGPIVELDPLHDTLTVIGQTVRITSETRFGDSIRPATLAALSTGEQVSVSGRTDADGALIATRIDRWPGGAGWLASGSVSQLDAASGEFHLNQLPVRYADAVLFGFASNVVHDADRVRVHSDSWSGHGPSCCEGLGIDASAVEQIDYGGTSHTTAISGFITRWNGAQDFDINQRAVRSVASMRYFGPDMSFIREDPASIWIYAVGTLDSQGVLDAQLLFATFGAQMLLQGPLTAIDRESHVATVASVPVEVSDDTILSEAHDGKAKAISFDDLVVGDRILVSGEPLPNGHIAGLRVEQDAPSSDFYSWSGFSEAQKHRPDLDLPIGGTTIRAVTDSATRYYFGHTMNAGCSCRGAEPDYFWSHTVNPRAVTSLEVVGTWEGDHVNADSVFWLEE